MEAFEAAANYFAARIIDKAELDSNYDEDASITDIIDRIGSFSQANSKIAEEATRRFQTVIEQHSNYPEYNIPVATNAIKLGGMSDVDNYYISDTFGARNTAQANAISERCRQSVMRHLLFSTAADSLPDENRKSLLQNNGAKISGP